MSAKLKEPPAPLTEEILAAMPMVLSPKDVARILGVSDQTIRVMAQNDDIPHTRIGRGGQKAGYRFYKPTILEWLAKGTQPKPKDNGRKAIAAKGGR